MLQQPFMLIIFGPTGVGKSDAAIAIAQKFPAEIINIDMGQLYTPLTIGTAKPAWREEQVPHHLFDVIDEPIAFTVTAYRARIKALLHDIWSRGKLPILVGGSGFYLKSLFFPPRSPTIDCEPSELQTIPEDLLWAKLNDVDPERAQQLHPHDTYRIKRALAIWFTTHIKPSTQKPQFVPLAPFKLICFTRDRNQLYERINMRVDQMMYEGWMHEVAQLKNSPWEDFLRTKKIIGYDVLLDFLSNEQTQQKLAQAIDEIKQKTRNYAKRQLTFWRMLERELQEAITLREKSATITSEIESVNLTLCDINLYIDLLQRQLLPYFSN